jgi:hypothetical protein
MPTPEQLEQDKKWADYMRPEIERRQRIDEMDKAMYGMKYFQAPRGVNSTPPLQTPGGATQSGGYADKPKKVPSSIMGAKRG